MMRMLFVTGLVLAAVTSLFVAVLLLAPMIIAPVASWAISNRTGFERKVSGLEIGLRPIRITVTNLRLINPDFKSPVLTAGSADLTVSANGYWSNRRDWWQLTGENLRLLAGTNASGQYIWETGSAKINRDSAAPTAASAFSQVLLEDATMVIDRPGKPIQQLQLRHLQLTKEDDERLRIDTDGEFEDQLLRAQGTLALPNSERATEIQFSAIALGGRLEINGTVGSDGLRPGRAGLMVEFPSMEEATALLDQELSPLEPLELTGSLTASVDGRWQFEVTGHAGSNPWRRSRVCQQTVCDPFYPSSYQLS